MKNLITGATGFVGSHIAEKLIADGEQVIALARETSDTTYLKHIGADIRYGTLTSPASLREATKGIDRVFHVAAMTEEWIPKAVSWKINVEGTENLLDADRST